MPKALFLQYTQPAHYPPLDRGAHYLAENGWQVEFVGISGTGAELALELESHPAISQVLMKHGPAGRLRKFHYVRFALKCLWRIGAFRPDVVYCSDVWSYPVGLLASFIPGLKTVLHEHDTPGTLGGVGRFFRAIRGVFARRANICVLPQSERARLFQDETGAKCVRVAYNAPLLREVSDARESNPVRQFLLWYHGAIGPGQLPLTAVEALRYLPPSVHLRIAGYEAKGAIGYVVKILDRARQLGIPDRVEYVGVLPKRSELYAQASRCDLGLALFASRFREPMVGASNKPFDYLACGLPILMNQTPEWTTFFSGRLGMFACDPDDPRDIARAVGLALLDPRNKAEVSNLGREKIRTCWNFERQFQPIMEILDCWHRPTITKDVAHAG